MPQINYEPLDGSMTFGPCNLQDGEQEGEIVSKDYCRTFSGKSQHNANCGDCPCPFRMCKRCGRIGHPKTVAQPPDGSGLCTDCALALMVSKILKQKGKGKNADPPAPTPPTPDKGVTGISLDVGDLLPPVRFGKVGGKSPILCGKQLAEKLILFDKINGVRMKASKVTRELGLASPSYVTMIRQNIDALLEMYEIIEDCNLGFNPAVKIAQFPSEMRRDLAEKISGGIITIRSLELVIGRFREKKGRGRDKEKDLADLNALMRQYGIA